VTFSIVARCAQTGLFGVAIASSSPAVAARCAHARSAAGAVATQNITDPTLGPRILDCLSRGDSAQAALNDSLSRTEFAAYRQVLAIGGSGTAAVYSGSNSLGIVGSAIGAHCAAAGNLLARTEVPAALVAAFEAAAGHFGDRLLQALRAGLAAGGEATAIHSAGILIVREVSWPIVDLRVDWSDADPLSQLTQLWHIYQPQIEDYVRRALDPGHAPVFNV
jgi:uncharacterized Ntn-hydrolase superfamily protein